MNTPPNEPGPAGAGAVGHGTAGDVTAGDGAVGHGTGDPGPGGPGPGHSLGPLVRIDGRWLLGDHRDRTHLELTPEGIVPHADGRPDAVVPWGRFMSMGIAVTPHRWTGSRRTALLTLGQMAPLGLTGPHLTATVRHPYEYWTGRFSHHRGQHYAPHELAAAAELFAVVVDAGEAALLGDSAWLDGAVALIRPRRPPAETRAALAKLLAGTRAERGLRKP
ncbi:hypothetical protein ACIQ9P_38535 [Kitasatospora sp. NPDC094019]|uniref:hypothetical protein n=1 Tax=Kitasatospora sp. NPDC094019 TaxID=3364091 RepID=UPI0038199699